MAGKKGVGHPHQEVARPGRIGGDAHAQHDSAPFRLRVWVACARSLPVRSRIAKQAFADKLAVVFGLDAATAARYSNLAGDTTEMDEDDNLVIRDWSGHVIVRLPSSRLCETAAPSRAESP